MKQGAIRQISWAPLGLTKDRTTEFADRESIELHRAAMEPSEASLAAALSIAQLTPPPADAVEEAKTLLRIAAEVEGALLVQYLYAAYSILPGVSVSVPSTPTPILSDDWSEVITDIARQEMGHLITVQNLLLSLEAFPHLDRENLPWLNSDLYPFPFHLEPLAQDMLAKAVTAEAPLSVSSSDLADYQQAAALANAVAGQVSRVGQIYERLYFLFQDSDAPQAPWVNLVNPFPTWPSWHVPGPLLGFNQDRQAQPNEWRGQDATIPPDTAIYVLPTANRSDARTAIYAVAVQGEGPPSSGGTSTHFEKFLRIYREFRTYASVPGRPPFIRNQTTDPFTSGGDQPNSITNSSTLAWARLANTRYQMLLLDIGLALALGNSGSLPGTTAARRDFISWAIGSEMRVGIRKIGEALCEMPLAQNPGPNAVTAGLPFELPTTTDLPTSVPDQLAALRVLISQSMSIRTEIRQTGNLSGGQGDLLTFLDNTDAAISRKIGT